MEKIKELLDKIAGKSILFPTFLVGSFIILFSIIYNESYFIYGLVIFLYSLVAISFRLFFKDTNQDWFKKDDKNIRWVFWIYHLIQFLLIGVVVVVLMVLFYI